MMMRVRRIGIVTLLMFLFVAPSAFAQGISGARQVCDGGQAAGFACSNVDIISLMERSQLTVDPVELDPFGNVVQPNFHLNDMWGWKHEASGRSFLLVGRTDGTAFVEVTDPYNPRLLGDLLSNYVKTDGSRNTSWRDIKVYRDHAYIVADSAPGHGIQIFDLTQLLNVEADPVRFEATSVYHGVSSVHNIVINEESGFAYAVGSRSGGETCGAGYHMVDLSDPEDPIFAGCHFELGTSRNGGSYTHDAQCVIYHGPDDDWTGKEICIGANESSVLVSDVTDKNNPQAISIGQYPATAYTHQGWLSEDHRYYFQGDELDEVQNKVPSTRTLIWDLQDLDDPQMVTEYLAPRQTIDHNMYTRGHLLFQSQYVDGLRIVDITDPMAPQEVGFLDTHPADLGVWEGSWSNYPYLDDNMVAVTSSVDGLFIAQPNSSLVTGIEKGAELPADVALLEFYPNPFADQGQFDVSLRTSGALRVELIDMLGRSVRTVYDGHAEAGQVVHGLIDGVNLAHGMYMLRIKGDTFEASHRILRVQ